MKIQNKERIRGKLIRSVVSPSRNNAQPNKSHMIRMILTLADKSHDKRASPVPHGGVVRWNFRPTMFSLIDLMFSPPNFKVDPKTHYRFVPKNRYRNSNPNRSIHGGKKRKKKRIEQLKNRYSRRIDLVGWGKNKSSDPYWSAGIREYRAPLVPFQSARLFSRRSKILKRCETAKMLLLRACSEIVLGTLMRKRRRRRAANNMANALREQPSFGL